MTVIRTGLLCLFVVLLPREVRPDCTKINSCSCSTSEGVIDLSPLDGKGTPTFKDLADSLGSGYLFSWNPCSPFSEANDCNDMAACQVSQDMQSSYPLGTQDSATFITDPTTGDLVLQYTATDGTGTTRTTQVTLLCDPSTPAGTLQVVGETTTLTYAMALSSVHCCPSGNPNPGPPGGGGGGGGLSTGSILVIALVGLIVVYAVGGVLVQIYVRKASGKERIPNYALWSSLPGLIKDGFVFTFTLGKSRRAGYDKV